MTPSTHAGSAADIRRLYLAFPLMGLAISIVAAGQFFDMILLRLGLNMQQFGLIKGLGLWVPMTLNLLLAPLVARLDLDRWIAPIGHVIRVLISFLFLLLPYLTRDPAMLTVGFTLVYIAWMIPPIVANNSLFVLCRRALPHETLGRHMSYISVLWNLPGPFAAIVAGWYVQRHVNGTDDEFFLSMFWAFFWSGLFILPSAYCMWRIRAQASPDERSAHERAGLSSIFEPFRLAPFRAVLKLIFALTTVSGMITSFMYPYLLQAQGLTLWEIGIVDAAVSILGLIAAVIWSRLIDRFGGSNAIRIATVGVAIGLFFFTGYGWLFVAIYAFLSWGGERGLFGTASGIGQRYLMLSQADPKRTHLYVAAVTFVSGCGYLVGSVGGGWLLEWLQARTRPELPYEHFRIYFVFCAIACLLMGDLIGMIKEDRRRVSSVEMAIEVARTLRGLATRSR